MLAELSRNFFIFLSKNKALNQAAKQWGLQFGASHVVAGQTIPHAIEKVKELNQKGLVCTLDHLGEFVSTREEALESTDYCIRTLDAIDESNVECNLSLKLTQLGLDMEVPFCLDNMKRIMAKAHEKGIFVRIDMEDYSRYHQTLDILHALREEYDNVGTVIQSYLHCSKQDIQTLHGIPLRIVKGAYKESPSVAYQEKEAIDENYMALVQEHLRRGNYTAVATHDHRIIEKIKQWANEKGIEKNQFEFQMLYGFRTQLQEQLVQEGYTVRVYVPFGNDWFGYFMRRLAERPQNVAFAFRGFFSK